MGRVRYGIAHASLTVIPFIGCNKNASLHDYALFDIKNNYSPSKANRKYLVG